MWWLLKDAADAMRLSARGYHRVLRVARTLADLDGADKVGRLHLAEALSYRAMADEMAGGVSYDAQVTSMNNQLEKLSRGSLRFIRLALLGLLFVSSQSHSQEAGVQEAEVLEGGQVPLSALSGKRIDKDWFRYTNGRFGLAIDIPTRGYRYVLPANGSGMAVTSGDEKIWITIYAHFVANHPVFIADPDDPDLRDAAAAISRIYDHEVAETLATGSTITYSVKKKDFYVLAGTPALRVSSECCCGPGWRLDESPTPRSQRCGCPGSLATAAPRSRPRRKPDTQVRPRRQGARSSSREPSAQHGRSPAPIAQFEQARAPALYLGRCRCPTDRFAAGS